MIVKLKQNLNNGKKIYKANTIIDLSKELGYEEIPDKLKDVLEEVRVASNLKVEIIDDDKEEVEKEVATKAKKTTSKAKKTSKSTNTLDLENLDVNV